MSWILVIYLAGYINGSHSGGPATAEFLTSKACEEAAATIKEKSGRYYIWHSCVPNGR